MCFERFSFHCMDQYAVDPLPCLTMLSDIKKYHCFSILLTILQRLKRTLGDQLGQILNKLSGAASHNSHLVNRNKPPFLFTFDFL